MGIIIIYFGKKFWKIYKKNILLQEKKNFVYKKLKKIKNKLKIKKKYLKIIL
jgi:hypothetical protein